MTTGSVRVLLRLEGLAALAVALGLYRESGSGWILFAALFLVPDLSMLGYLVNPRTGSVAYNTVHSYLLPVALIAAAYLLGRPEVYRFAYIWIAHIGFDRVLGYGLKYPESFGATHLGALGRRRAAERAA